MKKIIKRLLVVGLISCLYGCILSPDQNINNQNNQNENKENLEKRQNTNVYVKKSYKNCVDKLEIGQNIPDYSDSANTYIPYHICENDDDVLFVANKSIYRVSILCFERI